MWHIECSGVAYQVFGRGISSVGSDIISARAWPTECLVETYRVLASGITSIRAWHIEC